MNTFSKFLRFCVSAMLAIVIFTNSRPAQASIGILSGSPVVVTAGLVVGATGVGAGVYTIIKTSQTADPISALFTFLIGAVVTGAILGLGVLLLDGEQTIAYQQLSLKEAKKIGVTEGERQEYNANIDQVNALVAYVDQEVTKIEGATVEDSAAIWASVKEAVSPAVYSTMQKVTLQLYK